MKTRKIGYWVSTALVALAFSAGGVLDLLRAEPVLEGLQRLGYPSYFATILGVWKLLGVATIVAPGLPRLKEWAYAGMFFDLTGALASHLFVGDPPVELASPALLVALLGASWALRPPSRAPVGHATAVDGSRPEYALQASG